VGWACSVCGEYHDEALRDIRVGLPDPVFALAEADRARQAELGDDFCIYAETSDALRYFVRGLLHLPIRGDLNADFRYAVWVETDGPGYLGLTERWHDDLGHESAPVFGRLANELLPYPGSEGLDAALQLREVSILPAVILVESKHPLSLAQRHGIDEAQANSLAETVLH
jgi:hypothetical protein